ncbi:MAG: ECF-type sigma factor [Planctomycetota bacterium]
MSEVDSEWSEPDERVPDDSERGDSARDASSRRGPGPNDAGPAGDRDAERSKAFAQLYAELRARASSYMFGYDAGITIQPTALVHETYLRMFDGEPPHVTDRTHLLALASRAMRHVLVDHVRSRRRLKRRAQGERVPLDDFVDWYEGRDGGKDLHDDDGGMDIEALSAAIDWLAEQDPAMARAVDLHFFAGLTREATATALGISASTFDRRWKFIRSTLRSRLRPERT